MHNKIAFQVDEHADTTFRHTNVSSSV